MKYSIKNTGDVAEWRLCTGCGACVHACESSNIKLMNFLDDGIRPVINKDQCKLCGSCLEICPGYKYPEHKQEHKSQGAPELMEAFGSILDVYEGHAIDESVRSRGSSGGVVTAISLYCLEMENMSGLIHTSNDESNPLFNRTYITSKRHEILKRAGSRYSPASPCDALDLIKDSHSCSIFVGKPCDIAATHKYKAINSDFDRNLGLTIGIFCAGTPSTNGTIDLLKNGSSGASSLSQLEYRAGGFPGFFVGQYKDEENIAKLPYKEAWGFLQKYRPLRCYLCPDGTSEFADISCGDPWYREIHDNDLGSSLILIRTEKGRRIFNNAIQAGYIAATKSPTGILIESQVNLIQKRKEIWGRLFSMYVVGIPTPKYSDFPLFNNWLTVQIKIKIKSILGTFKRIIIRHLWKRQNFLTEAENCQPVPSPVSSPLLSLKKNAG